MSKKKRVVLQTLNLSAVMTPRFRNHRRLKLYAAKGAKCVSCGVEGKSLIQWHPKGRPKDVHWDVFTNSGHMITVDHIIPKHMGGPNYLWNYQPMCSSCNSTKGGKQPKFITHSGHRGKIIHYYGSSETPIGALVFRVNDKPKLVWYNTDWKIPEQIIYKGIDFNVKELLCRSGGQQGSG